MRAASLQGEDIRLVSCEGSGLRLSMQKGIRIDLVQNHEPQTCIKFPQMR